MSHFIKLNLINQSSDTNNSQVVIFQKNEADSPEELAVAWKVIQNCSPGRSYPFSFSADLAIAASDSYDNYTPQLPAANGQQYTVQQSTSGDRLVATGAASAENNIELLNGLKQGAINASIYRDGKLLATKTSIAPAQKAVFLLNPAIWVGVVSEVLEGQVMNSAIISNVNAQIGLTGITEANILMTGGGAGPTAQPYKFSLVDVVEG